MLSKVFSAPIIGLDAVPVEIDIASQGLPSFTIVRLLDKAVEEVKESVRSTIRNSGAKDRTTLLAIRMMIASKNLCPCGYLGDKSHICTCTAVQISRYKKKVSGPLLDWIDIHLDVPAVKVARLTEQNAINVENSEKIRERVQKARNRHHIRYKRPSLTSNVDLTNKTFKVYCKFTDDCIMLLRQAVVSMGLSGRAYYRISKLSRAITALADEEHIQTQHSGSFAIQT